MAGPYRNILQWLVDFLSYLDFSLGATNTWCFLCLELGDLTNNLNESLSLVQLNVLEAFFFNECSRGEIKRVKLPVVFSLYMLLALDSSFFISCLIYLLVFPSSCLTKASAGHIFTHPSTKRCISQVWNVGIIVIQALSVKLWWAGRGECMKSLQMASVFHSHVQWFPKDRCNLLCVCTCMCTHKCSFFLLDFKGIPWMWEKKNRN